MLFCLQMINDYNYCLVNRSAARHADAADYQSDGHVLAASWTKPSVSFLHVYSTFTHAVNHFASDVELYSRVVASFNSNTV